MRPDTRIAVIGGGIGGLTLALELHAAGVGCQVFEAAADLSEVGVGINLLPHATRHLAKLGVADQLAAVAIETRESVYFNRFGQHIYTEPVGRNAGDRWPQFSIHRGDLQAVLAREVRTRLGSDALATGHRCLGAEQDENGVTLHFAHPDGDRSTRRADAVVGCDGVHSILRGQLHPDEGSPVYSGYTMWRGVTAWPPVLSGASMIRAGWLATGKMVVYPIRDRVDEAGRQLLNWVAEIEAPQRSDRDWNRIGHAEDFIEAFAGWHFDWLDVPELIRSAEGILVYPMVDQEPLPWWGTGKITLLGDAAHPMVPRGSNGAGQAVLDARALANALAGHPGPKVAFEAYEAERRPATAAVVHANRTSPPDTILRAVYERTGDRPFEQVADVISDAEMDAVISRYKQIAGYSADALHEAA